MVLPRRPTTLALRVLGGLLALILCLGVFIDPGAAAEKPVLVRVNTFPNAKALPFHAGIAKGIFLKHGIRLDLAFTDNSRNQREGLAAGKFDVAQSALDNAVAMVEVAQKDVVIVGGGDSGMNEFFVQAGITSFADLRGRILIVDAPDTAYALQAKKILLQHGLKEGADYTVKPVGAGVFRFKAMAENKDNAAAILNLPFTVQAEQLGMRSLGRTVDMLGPYQAGGAFVMRDWAARNGTTLERYLAGYVESLRWVRDPANRGEAVALLVEKLKLPQKVAERTHELLVDPSFGFNVDGKFDDEGFRNLLALRAELQRKDGEGVAPERYVDLGYYERAMRRLGP
jgi:ABC-type nitrate/sulfonate/bicarbonate transport system substrate-binding protein